MGSWRWNIRAVAVLCCTLLQSQVGATRQGLAYTGKTRALLQQANGAQVLMPVSFLDMPSLQQLLRAIADFQQLPMSPPAPPDETVEPETKETPNDSADTDCYEKVPNRHTLDEPIMNGNSKFFALDEEGCWNKCLELFESTGCRSASWAKRSAGNRCYLKNVDAIGGSTGNMEEHPIWSVLRRCGLGSTDANRGGGTTETGAENGNQDTNQDEPDIGKQGLWTGGTCPEQSQKLAVGFATNEPRTTRYGVLKQTTLEFATKNQLCGSSLTIKGTVVIKRDGACRPCPGAKCRIWAPNGEGEYDTECSATVIADDNGQFQFKSDEPGNERSKLWGPDPFGHWHYDCSGCGGSFFNKFYSKQHDFSGLTEKGIGRPNSSNHASKVEGQTDVLVYNMLMEA